MELGDDHRGKLVALDIRLDKSVLLAGEPQRDPRGVLDHHLFRLLVQVDALHHILLYPGLFENAVHLGIGVGPVVHATVRVEQDVQEILWIWIVGRPAQTRVCLELPFVQVLQVRGPLNLLDLHLHPNHLLPHLDYDLQVEADGTPGPGNGDDNSRPRRLVGVFRLAEQSLGKLRVVAQSLQFGVVGGEPWRQDTVCGLYQL